MLTIKRYSNRKLYDPQSGRYITLEEIGEAVRRGEDLRVVDHATGADLTTLTLLQILLEEERRTRSWLPHQLLARLLRAGEERLDAFRELLGGSLDSHGWIDRSIRRRVEQLIARGRLTQEEASRWLELLLDPDLFEQEEPPIAELQPATSAEVQNLLAEIERLEAAVDDIISRP